MDCFKYWMQSKTVRRELDGIQSGLKSHGCTNIDSIDKIGRRLVGFLQTCRGLKSGCALLFAAALLFSPLDASAQLFRRARVQMQEQPRVAVQQEPSVRPAYVPSVDESYFWGETSPYPDPNEPPQHFTPAVGESHPRTDEEVRAIERNERFAVIRKRLNIDEQKKARPVQPREEYVQLPNTGNGSSEFTLMTEAELSEGTATQELDWQNSVSPLADVSVSNDETATLRAAGLLNEDGTTVALPAPTENGNATSTAPVVILESDEPLDSKALEPTEVLEPLEIQAPENARPAAVNPAPSKARSILRVEEPQDSTLQNFQPITPNATDSGARSLKSQAKQQLCREAVNRNRARALQGNTGKQTAFFWNSDKENSDVPKYPTRQSIREAQERQKAAAKANAAKSTDSSKSASRASSIPTSVPSDVPSMTVYSAETTTALPAPVLPSTTSSEEPVVLPDAMVKSTSTPASRVSGKQNRTQAVETRGLAVSAPNTLVQQTPNMQVQSRVEPQSAAPASSTVVVDMTNPASDTLPWKRPGSPWYAAFIQTVSNDEAQMLKHVLMNDWSQDTLLEAAILASRPSSSVQALQIRTQYLNRRDELKERIGRHDSDIVKAETILRFLHEEIFREYQLENTTLENLFNGRYNCVTATIVFCSLGRELGLNVVPVELPGHAMCRVLRPNGTSFDVETTCKTWFQYQDDKETRDRIICDLIRQANGASAETTTEALLSQVRQVSDRVLLAKVYYNRGVDLLTVKDFAGALEANSIAMMLDRSSETTHGNLLATMNNWAIDLCRNGKYAEAASLLRLGLQKEPNYLTFRNNHIHVYHRWVEALYQEGDIARALQVTNMALAEQPQEKHFMELQKTLQISYAEGSVVK